MKFILSPTILLYSIIVLIITRLIYVLTQQLNFQNRTRWMYLINSWNTMEFTDIIYLLV
jgi:hypothetical protein